MAIYARSVSHSFAMTSGVCAANGSTLPIYGTLEKADNYFASTLEGQRWCCTEREEKFKALVSATRRIDRLNFGGSVTAEGQAAGRQFPRGTDTLVPVDIEIATYELAQALLNGAEPDTERASLSQTVRAFGGLRSEFDRSIALPCVAAGIPCPTAWDLLVPYLLERRGIQLERVS